MENKKDSFLNLAEASELLGITKEELQRLAEAGEVEAYKIGGVFLRFKAENLHQIKEEVNKKLENLAKSPPQEKTITSMQTYTFWERVKDFWYFYDFYIVTLVIILFILYIIFEIEI